MGQRQLHSCMPLFAYFDDDFFVLETLLRQFTAIQNRNTDIVEKAMKHST